MSEIRQNFDQECESQINRQINMELNNSYEFLSMAYFMDRQEVALPGFHEYSTKASDDSRERAMKLMDYQNKRGGRIQLLDISPGMTGEWENAGAAMVRTRDSRMSTNQAYLDLHKLAKSKEDPHLCDFLETEFLPKQSASIKDVADIITNIVNNKNNPENYIIDIDIGKATVDNLVDRTEAITIKE